MSSIMVGALFCCLSVLLKIQGCVAKATYPFQYTFRNTEMGLWSAVVLQSFQKCQFGDVAPSYTFLPEV